jgi:hypothetical protein
MQKKSDGRDERDTRFGNREYDLKRFAIIDACAGVMKKLTPQKPDQGDGPIVCADFVGPDCQYSHGLSIYFPWSEPLEDENDHVIENYKDYAFSADSAAVSWFDFLGAYFEKTRRDDRMTEEQNDGNLKYRDPSYQELVGAVRDNLQAAVATTNRDFFPMSVLEGKVSPPDSSGGACSCASTKNYSRVFTISPGASTVFAKPRPKPPKPKTKTATAQRGGPSAKSRSR